MFSFGLMRIDKYLWAIRLFKTRSAAAKACNAMRSVKLDKAFAKASKDVAVGKTILLKESSVWRTFQIIDIPKSRVAAALVSEYLLETTPTEQLLMLAAIKKERIEAYKAGTKGKPDKAERRSLRALRGK